MHPNMYMHAAKHQWLVRRWCLCFCCGCCCCLLQLPTAVCDMQVMGRLSDWLSLIFVTCRVSNQRTTSQFWQAPKHVVLTV